MEISMYEFADMVRSTSAKVKSELPLVKFATFKNDRRSDANLIACTAVEGDYDGGEVTIKEAAEMCRGANVSALFYASPSSTPENPRWRVIAPLSEPVGPKERSRMLARLNGVLGGILAPESFTLSQQYFYGSVGRKELEVAMVAEKAVDLLDRLDAGAIGKGEASRERTKAKDSIDRSAVLQAIAIEVVKAGGTLEDFDRQWPQSQHAKEHVLKHTTQALQRRAIERTFRWAKSQVAPLTDNLEEKGRNVPPKVDLFRYEDRDVSKIPPRQFLYGPAYIRGFVSALVAPGGAAKTSLTITEALSMASGRDLLNIGENGKPALLRRPLNVCLWNLEDDVDEMERRIKGAQIYFMDALAGADIKAHLFVNAATEGLKLGRAVKGVAELDLPLIKALVSALRKAKIDVLIVDPFISSHGVPESDNDAIDVILKEGWGRVARDARCSVTLVHHVRKGPAGIAREVSIEDARGASALINACRFGRVINRMSPDQAPALGVPSEMAWAYLRVDPGKANLAPPGVAAWRRLQTAELGNGTSFEADNGDRIGVVEAWTPPDLSKTTSGDRDLIIDAMGRRTWRKDIRAGDSWIGVAVARALELDLNKPVEKAQVKAKIKAALNSGWLVEGVERVGSKNRPIVRVKERRQRTLEDLLGSEFRSRDRTRNRSDRFFQ